jgi:DMSO/TMAO reductase YedYZ molybdopterin-dependent catalytic subunit
MKKVLATIIITLTILSITANLNIYVQADTTTPTALTITGLVNNPTNLTLTQLQALPKTTEYATIICVDAPGTILEQGNWTGIQLDTLLQTAGIKSGAVKVAIAASDGFSSDLTIDEAKQSNIILAYEKDGQALSSLRLVVPGRWGYKWVNMVTSIEVMNYDYLGFWESKGYSDSAIIGQDPGGGSGAKPPQSTPPTNTQTSTTTPTPNPSAAPTPSQNTTIGTQTTQSPTTQNPIQTNLITTEAIYGIAIALIVAVAVTALIVHKKVKR